MTSIQLAIMLRAGWMRAQDYRRQEAARLGVTPSAIAMRLKRGKLTVPTIKISPMVVLMKGGR